MNFGIIIPTYNEEKNIVSLVDNIRRSSTPKFIVIIDDSKRSMKSLLLKKNIIYIHRKKKLGRGSAVILGMKVLIKKKLETFIEMDADHSHSPSEIKKNLFIFNKKNLDLLIASRYEKKSQIIGWPLRRRVLSRLANLLAKFFLKVPINDYTNGFRIYSRRAVLRVVKNFKNSTDEFIILSEIVTELYYANYLIDSIETKFVDRKFGKSSVNFNLLIKSFFGLLLIFFKYRRKF
jgi:dolichol-phosphate mannosyltransferase